MEEKKPWLPGKEANWREAIAPYDRPEHRLDPKRCALILVDMQRAFLDTEGSAHLPASSAALDKLIPLLEAWRCQELPVFFTRHVHKQPHLDGGALARWWRSLILVGSEDAELVDELVPRENEAVLDKCRYSAFAGTPLESMLRAADVDSVLIGGVMTHLCCETTAREAFVRDFDVFFLGDGTATVDATLHLSALCTIAHGFGRVLSVAEAVETLAG